MIAVRVAAVLVLMLATVSCSRSSAPTNETVEVRLRFSRFIPDHYEFPVGSTVTFVVTNDDPIDHEFIIGDEDVQESHEKGTEPHHGAKPGEISIPAEKTRSTTYKFDEPGELIIGCHLPSHYDYGMKATIRVS